MRGKRTAQNESINLDLIQRVQAARMAHDEQAVPSQMKGVYWIEAKRQAEGAAPTSRAGRFIIRTTLEAIDALWADIRRATQAGELGYKARTATHAQRLGVDSSERVIHVVTYDADDLADRERVRQRLIALGIPPDALTYEPYHESEE
jgi:hypothetical protein